MEINAYQNKLIKNGDTALIVVCSNNSPDIALRPIERFGDKCKPEQFNSDGNTALILACTINSSEIYLSLIERFGDRCKPEQINKEGYTALKIAQSKGLAEVVSKLKNM